MRTVILWLLLMCCILSGCTPRSEEDSVTSADSSADESIVTEDENNVTQDSTENQSSSESPKLDIRLKPFSTLLDRYLHGSGDGHYEGRKANNELGVKLDYKGAGTVYAPDIVNSHYCAYFITIPLTVIALSPYEPNEPVGILISRDMGQTWFNTEIILDEQDSQMKFQTTKIDFFDSSMTEGYLVLLGSEQDYGLLYLTSDSGKTWKREARFETTGVVDVTLVTKEKGFMCGHVNDNAIIFQTNDRGHTWEQKEIKIPKEIKYDRGAYFKSPIFDGQNGLLPLVLLFEHQNASYAFFGTNDYGDNWLYLGSETDIAK